MVTSVEAGIAGLVVMVLLLFTSLPIGAVMGLVGFAGFAYLSGIDAAWGLLQTVPFTTAASPAMSVMPMFVLMGELSFHSGISKDLYNAAHKWFGHMPGGLAMGTVWAGAGFGALCGSGPAATATLGAVALPEMRKYNYDRGFAAATIAAAGTLSIIIPPSTILIIYGLLTETSVGKLFIAGILPGIVLSVLYCITIYIEARRDPYLAPAGPRYGWKERFASLSGAGPMLLLFAFVMGGMWGGAFTATEGGALGAFGALVFTIYRRKLNRESVVACLTSTINIMGMVFMLLMGASIFGYFIAITNVPIALAAWLKSLSVAPIWVAVGILVIYFVLGFAMDELTMIVLTTPLFFPVLMDLGFDPIWWGVMVIIAILQGQLSPPVGCNLNIICGLTKADTRTADIFRRVMPYVGSLFVFMVILILFPGLATWLPSVMK